MQTTLSAAFESFGTRFLLNSNDQAVLERVTEIARSALLGNLHPCSEGPYPLTFDLPGSKDLFDVIRNGEFITRGTDDFFSFRHLSGLIRLSVAEFSRDLIFLHAGAVGWRGKGIVLPGVSFAGKSTLVYELVKLGAEYYSDDLAIFDHAGHLLPFPRTISMRTRETYFEMYEVDAAEIGTKGTQPIPVGLVFFTTYRARSRWRPKTLSRGEGILEMVPFTLPLRHHADLGLRVLNTVAIGATMAKSDRGDATIAARKLLELLDMGAI